MYDPDGIDRAARACENKGAKCVYGGAVQKIHDTKNGQAKRILIVTNAFITYIKNPNKSPDLVRTRFWSDITSISYDNRSKIELKFKKEQLRFHSHESRVIMRKIADILIHTFSPAKIAQLHLDNIPHPEGAINPVGTFYRFEEQLIKRGLVPNKVPYRNSFRTDIFKLNRIIKPRPPEEFLQVVEPFFYAIVSSPFTRAIFLPKVTESSDVSKLYSGIIYLVKKPTTITFINMKLPIDNPKFADLSNELVNKAATRINGFGFSSIEMTEKDAEDVKKLAEAKTLSTLRLTKLKPLSVIPTILEGHVSENLRYLALDKSSKLDFEGIAPLLQNIAVLSLARCDLEISEVFEVIQNHNFEQLRLLNLSENKATKPFSDETVILSTIQRIDVNKCTFGDGVARNIFETILNAHYDNGFKFFANKIKTSKGDTEELLAAFAEFTCDCLYEFSWKGNKVSEELIDFLARNPHLNTLYFHKNITSNTKSILQHFVENFPYFKGLTHLIVTGGKNSALEGDFITLLHGLKDLQHLRYLDVSGNKIGESGISAIASELPSIKRLSHIAFEDCEINSIEPILSLIKNADKINRKILISWPSKDLQRLAKEKKIRSEAINDLKAELQMASTGIKYELPSRRASIVLDEIANLPASPEVPAATPKKNKKDNKKSMRGSMRVSKNPKGGQDDGSIRRIASRSLFIRAGSVRNIKRPIQENELKVQDPDSIYIKPFEVWVARVNGNFPEYYTEQLENEFGLNTVQLEEAQKRPAISQTFPDELSDSSTSSKSKSDNEIAPKKAPVSVRKPIPTNPADRKDKEVEVNTYESPLESDTSGIFIELPIRRKEEKKKSKKKESSSSSSSSHERDAKVQDRAANLEVSSSSSEDNKAGSKKKVPLPVPKSSKKKEESSSSSESERDSDLRSQLKRVAPPKRRRPTELDESSNKSEKSARSYKSDKSDKPLPPSSKPLPPKDSSSESSDEVKDNKKALKPSTLDKIRSTIKKAKSSSSSSEEEKSAKSSKSNKSAKSNKSDKLKQLKPQKSSSSSDDQKEPKKALKPLKKEKTTSSSSEEDKQISKKSPKKVLKPLKKPIKLNKKEKESSDSSDKVKKNKQNKSTPIKTRDIKLAESSSSSDDAKRIKKTKPLKPIKSIKQPSKKISSDSSSDDLNGGKTRPPPTLKPVKDVLKPLPKVKTIEPASPSGPSSPKEKSPKKNPIKKISPIKRIQPLSKKSDSSESKSSSSSENENEKSKPKITPIKKIIPVKPKEPKPVEKPNKSSDSDSDSNSNSSSKKEKKNKSPIEKIKKLLPKKDHKELSGSSSSEKQKPLKELPKSSSSDGHNKNHSSSDSDKKPAIQKRLVPIIETKGQKPKLDKLSESSSSSSDNEDKPSDIKERKIELSESDSSDHSQKRKQPPEPEEEVSALHDQIVMEPISSIRGDSSSSSSDDEESKKLREKDIPQAASPRSGRTSAPDLNIEDTEDAESEQFPEAVKFSTPSWSFPIPRTTRVSNKKLVKELEDKYSTHAVINALKSTQ